MRDKKMYISAILLTTVMLFAGGCGKQAEPVSGEPMETVKEADTEGSSGERQSPDGNPNLEENLSPEENIVEGSEESAGEKSEPTPAPVPEESTENPETEGNPEKEADTVEEESGQDLGYGIIPIDDTVMYATADCNIRSGAGTQYAKVGSLSYAQEVTVNGKVEAGEGKLWYVIKTEDGSTQMVSAGMLSETKPASQTSAVNGPGSGSGSGGSTGGTGNSETASSGTESNGTSNGTASNGTTGNVPAQSAHTHSWKEHVATSQTWIPNIVVVDDYETQYVAYDHYICDCGFETDDPNIISEHFKECYRSGNSSFFGIQTHYSEQQVKVGSHEEDHGHYETSTYVDYYYCDCGATK